MTPRRDTEKLLPFRRFEYLNDDQAPSLECGRGVPERFAAGPQLMLSRSLLGHRDLSLMRQIRATFATHPETHAGSDLYDTKPIALAGRTVKVD